MADVRRKKINKENINVNPQMLNKLFIKEPRIRNIPILKIVKKYIYFRNKAEERERRKAEAYEAVRSTRAIRQNLKTMGPLIFKAFCSEHSKEKMVKILMSLTDHVDFCSARAYPAPLPMSFPRLYLE